MEPYGWLAILEERFLRQRTSREHIVIEIEKLLFEAFDPVEKHLDHARIESGKISLGDDVFVKDHMHRIPVDP